MCPPKLNRYPAPIAQQGPELPLDRARRALQAVDLSEHYMPHKVLDGTKEIEVLPEHVLLIAIALGWGFKVTVGYEEDIDLADSTDIAEILTHVEASEEVELIFTNQEDVKVGWARVSVYGLDADETVIDFTVDSWLEEATDAIFDYFTWLEDEPSIAITSEQ